MESAGAPGSEQLLKDVNALLQQHCEQLGVYIDGRLAAYHRDLVGRLPCVPPPTRTSARPVQSFGSLPETLPIQSFCERACEGAPLHKPAASAAAATADQAAGGEEAGVASKRCEWTAVAPAEAAGDWATGAQDARQHGAHLEVAAAPVGPKLSLRSRSACNTCDGAQGMVTGRVHKNPMVVLDDNRTAIQAIVSSRWFEVVICVLIAGNVVFFGFEVEAQMGKSAESLPGYFKVVEYFFTIIFLVELIMRVFAHGTMAFVCGQQRVWNAVEVLLVLLSLIDIFLDIATSDMDIKFEYARVIRISKAARIFRAVRILKLLKQLRILVHTILETFRSLFWTMVLLVLIIYVFGVSFAVMSSHELAERTPIERQGLERYFGSLRQAMLTLFMAITGGQEWRPVVDELQTVSEFSVMVFVFYIAMCHLAVLNVVSGVVLHSAIKSAEEDQDIVVQMHMSMKARYAHQLESMFHNLDKDNSGYISLEEFQEHLLDPDLQAYFCALELTTDQAWSLFQLLDVNGTALINVDEFVSGCLRLKGAARSIDMHMLLYESRWIIKTMTRMMARLESPEEAEARLPPVDEPVSLS